jgi:hypothetical protein
MKVFDHFNLSGKSCPICGTWDDKQAVLVSIDGTEDNGLIECKQVHLDCLRLRYTSPKDETDSALVYQCFKNNELEKKA